MMQIRELVLYNHDGERRQLQFHLGKVNIITGESQTGKSVIGSIIDYCLGGQECNIADGVVRETVSWYGLLLQFDHERLFVARQNPGIGASSTSACYFEIGIDLETPMTGNFVSNINVNGLEEIISKRLGIEDNLHIPQKGQTQEAIKANIRHSLFYCIQGQDEIAAKSYLFHRQAELFMTQTIKNTMPYFLGAINGKALEYEAERKEKKREYLRMSRERSDIQESIKNRSTKGRSLLSEAIEVGLADEGCIDASSFNAVYEYLKGLNLEAEEALESMQDQKTSLQDERSKLIEDLSRVRADIDEARKYQNFTNGFNVEAEHQKKRLESIGLFEKLSFETGRCPFCSAELTESHFELEAAKASILELDTSINRISKEKPHIQHYIEEREAYAKELADKRRAIDAEINAIINT